MPVRTLLCAGLLALSGCSAGYSYLPLGTTEPGAENADRPRDVIPAAVALADCAGARLGEPLVHLACHDAQEAYVARYDAEVGPEACRAIASDVYRGAALSSGPDLRLPSPSQTFRTDIETPTGTVSAVVSCSPASGGGLLFLTAIGGLRLESAFYTRVLPAIAYDGVPGSVVAPQRPDTLDFLGRTFPIHPSCRLEGARNLSCYPSGQMDWSEFGSIGDARAASVRRVEASVAAGATVLADEEVGCTFEGVATSCRRVTYRMPVSRILTLGASNTLVAYYVAEQVRGRNAQAVCSFYDDQAPEGGLAALCAESFELSPRPVSQAPLSSSTVPLSSWWQSQLRDAEAELAKPLRRPAMIVLVVLAWGGLGLALMTGSIVPAGIAWATGVILMLKYRVAWWGWFLARRDHEPGRYWVGFVAQVFVAVILILASALELLNRLS